MNKNKLVLAIAAASMLLGSGTLSANGDQPFHVTGQAGSLYTDSKRNTRDDDVWWSVGFGYFFTDNFSLDIEYDKFSGTWRDHDVAVPGATFDQWGLENIGLMARYHFTDWKVRPFLAGGLGSLSHRNVSSEDSALSLSVGGGFRSQFTKHFGGTAQLLYRKDRDNATYAGRTSDDDWIWSSGLIRDVGGKRQRLAGVFV